jgi:hypothetical protein
MPTLADKTNSKFQFAFDWIAKRQPLHSSSAAFTVTASASLCFKLNNLVKI